ncbi:hypothetical protein PHLCEN_2v171 [Hermanssonia centrifuga]|uniref:Uncharacterized protein n=1 Tax=Hermanssonia centrifuga TaxID=98765 RepID=A0A2R6S6S8_9APHY|nr:hypothetical protein PHLCEN_2v171 [Hermanssonia centrifuga]
MSSHLKDDIGTNANKFLLEDAKTLDFINETVFRDLNTNDIPSRNKRCGAHQWQAINGDIF